MSYLAKTQAATSATGAIALADGTVFLGHGAGAAGVRTGELCFNTAITGYQEILTDPSYASQIVLFTFPHIGNVGTNDEDHEESSEPGSHAARGAIFREPITAPSNWRSTDTFDSWLKKRGIAGLFGVDTRAITRLIREKGMQKAAICHQPDGNIDLDALIEAARAWEGLETADLAADVDTGANFENSESLWLPETGYGHLDKPAFHVVVVDFGVKKNILRNLANVGIHATVVNGDASFEDIAALKPDGIVFSNGPGDPAATIKRSGDMIRAVIDSGLPILGICLGHQLLALALGAKTMKMAQGHHGANHPVKDLSTGKVEIVSMNHGFTVDPATLPAGVEESHRSLFDGTNSGLAVKDRPIISVQHHPEASPGPQDSFYLFQRFADLMTQHRAGK
ncbi:MULTISPECIES: glutamine-hydrolyzing carbamoyl-phosphate synthase small subunit [Hyphomonas]|uniref:Carbamoyl phosphate synthase small chain n=1 Tax=Hyphomonas adhaerens TaxID=81029 RepID=A0A3B9GWV1_9PROT|nr:MULTISPECIES: glutamine-hydrolyzing carbamoyl-phosphate synthase small subunit [Hyphomonas]MBB41370.1 carbamoyl phosphate synthase small subunit [Hyphomonas sp.]HAE26892.1 carbamoyl phosphate synthase small subunit [Hyphomonas adhaerens]|tara:strand:- start:1058 stop:2245 length:1188 start_codon:yes stop_codon:yes gene_type:complete